MGRLLDFANRVAFGALRDSIPENDAEDIDDDWEERFWERVKAGADYRDLDLWPRDKFYPRKDYPWKVYGYTKDGKKLRAMPTGTIPWWQLDTLMIHTTDTGALGPLRGLSIPAHGLISDPGTIGLLHKLNRRLPHGHSANKFSNGLEVSGRRTINAAQVEAGRLYIRWWCQTVRQNKALAHVEAGRSIGEAMDNMYPLYIIPHRHSHKSRRKDPDREVWEALGEWAIDEGLCKLGRVVGSGQRIPERGQPW